MNYSHITLPVGEIKPNRDNPRTITKNQFEALKKSISNNPKSLNLSPLLINDCNVILGGNMRFRALVDLGYKEIPCIKVEGLDSQKQKELIIKDNINYGDWDWNVLISAWDLPQLTDMGLPVPKFYFEQDQVREVDDDTTKDAFNKWLNNEKGQIKLFFDNATYDIVFSYFQRKNQDKSQILQELIDKYFEENNLIKDRR
jgi:hypothetical protein